MGKKLIKHPDNDEDEEVSEEEYNSKEDEMNIDDKEEEEEDDDYDIKEDPEIKRAKEEEEEYVMEEDSDEEKNKDKLDLEKDKEEEIGNKNKENSKTTATKLVKKTLNKQSTLPNHLDQSYIIEDNYFCKPLLDTEWEDIKSSLTTYIKNAEANSENLNQVFSRHPNIRKARENITKLHNM